MGRIIFFGWVVIAVPAWPAAADFAVSTRTVDNQTHAAIAADANGNAVVVWTSYRQDGSSGGIFGQRFAADGTHVGTEFPINTITAGNQTEPAVAMDAAGNFVVAWHGPGVIEEDVFARRFDANGQALGDEFRVNTVTESRQLCPGVAMNNDGNCVVVWESEDIPEVGKRAICGQLYDRSGTGVGDEFIVNDQPATCRYPAVTMHHSGKFIAVWVKDTTTNSVWIRRFEANGTAPYLSSRVNDLNFTSLTRPSIAIDEGGYYVTVWDGHRDTYLEDDIYLKRYHWSGVGLHGDFVVNTYKSGAQSNPSVTMSSDGEFIIVWQSETGDAAKGIDIFGQRFPSQGEHVGEPLFLGDQFWVNTYTADDQRYPAVVMDNDGGFITVWESYGQDGSGYGIFGEFGPRTGCADMSGDLFVNFRDYCLLADEWLKEGNPLQADFVDDNRIDKLDLAVLNRQWLLHCYDCNEVDIYGDFRIDLKDYAVWAADSSKQGPNLDGDITHNGIVDMADLRVLGLHWLKGCE